MYTFILRIWPKHWPRAGVHRITLLRLLHTCWYYRTYVRVHMCCLCVWGLTGEVMWRNERCADGSEDGPRRENINYSLVIPENAVYRVCSTTIARTSKPLSLSLFHSVYIYIKISLSAHTIHEHLRIRVYIWSLPRCIPRFRYTPFTFLCTAVIPTHGEYVFMCCMVKRGKI